MLYDKARIFVQGGGGGDGCMSFRREAHVPMGGPDGGDGGHGADVVFVCDDSFRDLQAFKRRAHYKAPRGRHGEGAQRHGASGEPLIVAVPPGTEITDLEGTVHDLVVPGRRVVVARGGSGGRGNRCFVSSTRQAPRFAERGIVGEEGWVDLRLKLLADVGLVGVPNAGKSSLLARLTRAAPKVANYPFTTLEPILGTLDGAERQLIIADIPGLIEGASEGHGLGHEFLAHVERTRLLVHVLDLEPLDGSDPEENYTVIERELELHDPRLASLPRILVLSKADLVSDEKAEEARARWQARFDAETPPREAWEPEDPFAATPVLVTSAATGLGLDELALTLFRRVPVLAAGDLHGVYAGAGDVAGTELDELPAHQTYKPTARKSWEVEGVSEGVWRVIGPEVERLLARHDLENEDALAHVEHRLGKMGVLQALADAGFQSGDDVEIDGVVFELD
ncbi:MAG: obgE [Solirubrobacterales bacterium]|nr:obgE [Solirubrobacterales bacterium]